MNAWLIRAGRGAAYLEDFISKNFVALGWSELGDLSHCSSKAEIMEIAEREMAGYRLGQIRSAVSQTARFLYEVQPGDRIPKNSRRGQASPGNPNGGPRYPFIYRWHA